MKGRNILGNPANPVEISRFFGLAFASLGHYDARLFGSDLVSSLRISVSSAPLRLMALNGQITAEAQRTQRYAEKTFQIRAPPAVLGV